MIGTIVFCAIAVPWLAFIIYLAAGKWLTFEQRGAGGTIVSGLVKTHTEEPAGAERTKVTTQWYDPESSPPKKIGNPIVEYRLNR